MKNQNPKVWNAQTLTQFGGALSVGKIPGLGSDAKVGDRWTARRHAQASLTLGQGYNHGV